jgi:hypothetical protein
MQNYEIVVFEDLDLYDGKSKVEIGELVDEFIKYYDRYFSLDYLKQKDVWFTRSRLWLSYTDKSSGDKPKTVFVIGHITDELVSLIKERVKKFYTSYCGDCGKEIDTDTWALCKLCRSNM